jgi:type IV pilus assembly protein PilV
MKTQKGFTLIEILVAMSLLSIGFLGASSLTVGIIKGNYHAKSTTTAIVLAQDKLEEFKRLGYPFAIAGTENYNTMPEFRPYKRVTTVSVNTPVVDMKTVNVEVFWKNDDHSVIVKTVLTP